MPFVSANAFTDFFKDLFGGVTGNAVEENCTASCVGKQCGDDGCSGSCGTCSGGNICNSYGICGIPCLDGDGGSTDAIFIKGSCQDYGGGTHNEDFCSGNTLIEQTCINNICTPYSQSCEFYGKVCQDGACVSCSDSDGGLNFNVKGTCTAGSLSKTDYCDSSFRIAEYQCTSSYPCYLTIRSCESGKICQDGACVTNSTTCTPKTCSQLGKTCGTWDNGCGTQINCGTCSTGQTCSNGICISTNATTCTDSDGGLNYNVKGTCNNGTSVQDYCSSTSLLKEYKCVERDCALNSYNCPTGQTCSDGACISNTTCTPTTCLKINMNCGTWNNGCGGTINCGSCLSGKVCNSNGRCIVNEKICALYLKRRNIDTRMIQGTWTNQVAYTSSVANCLSYMETNLFSKPGCANNATFVKVVLIDALKHTFDIPEISSEELVTTRDCPISTTPTAQETSNQTATQTTSPTETSPTSPTTSDQTPASVIEPTKETGPIEITEAGGECNGCILDDKCYPIGYRINSNYCDQEFSTQKETGVACENSFECSSNVCVSRECVSGSLIQKILNWFRRIFGNE